MAKQTMVETGRFSTTFLGQLAPAGRKVLGSSRPELIATSTKDKFTLNEKATMLMGVKEGSQIVMIDKNLYITNPEEKLSQNERFLIAVVDDSFEGIVNTATIGKTKSYSYSGVWSAIVMRDPLITEATKKDLVRAGLGILRGKNDSYVGLKKVSMELVPYVEGEDTLFQLAEGTNPVALYSLINAEVHDHDPKSIGKDGEENGEAAE
jgi:hypothetical protein